MKYAFAILAAATGALASWNGTVAYTTMIVTALTTYCPYATELTHNGIIYTVTKETTLTITDCPCTLTVTQPVNTPSTVLYTSCRPGAKFPPANNAPPASTPANPPYWNPLTISWATPTMKPNGGFATGTGMYPTKTAMFTGAARANKVGGMLVGAVAGVVAMAL